MAAVLVAGVVVAGSPAGAAPGPKAKAVAAVDAAWGACITVLGLDASHPEAVYVGRRFVTVVVREADPTASFLYDRRHPRRAPVPGDRQTRITLSRASAKGAPCS